MGLAPGPLVWWKVVWHSWLYYCVLLSFRLSDPDERAILIEEANLCVASCLHILKTVTKPYSGNYDLVLECLKNIEACVSFLQDTAILNKENETLLERMQHAVEESFEVSTKWCKRYLYDHKFPCHDMVEADKELQVCICYPFTVLLFYYYYYYFNSFIDHYTC